MCVRKNMDSLGKKFTKAVIKNVEPAAMYGVAS